MDKIDTSGRALVEFWKRVADKGLMKANTANAFRAACSQILAVDEDWQATDVATLNVEQLLRRFQNKRHADFKPDSLEAYKRRFQTALRSFLEYAEDPSSWKPPGQERNRRRDQGDNLEDERPSAPRSVSPPKEPADREQSSEYSEYIEYPFPLRPGRIARLKLPIDLTRTEVKRLAAFISTLNVEPEESPD